ncbi:hypothetical protein Z045_25035 [Rhodococcus pyridinivorans KG-16]|uniref:Solute-binding protein family 5 domain-containing protein n=1 Tax=Rhodococcus pyridinivorans KG-16 TaxID=1441730 RepID=A0A0V9UE56_9NOCA|nr:ABC transporter substrate-binding protein [Rhodococcus pyridinivorans]KSZ56119.1 hypothetical protein Z045_25035 [Rhodococcus pyridinivorans KG-16]
MSVAAASAALLTLTACGGAAASQSGNALAGGIVTAWSADLTTLDPATASSAQDWEVATNVYQGLLMPEWTTTDDGSLLWSGLDLAPGLASSFEMEGSTATLHLRDDVKFYPSGNPLTAEDVIFSFGRIFELGRTGDLNNGGLYGIDQFEVLDDHTIRVSFEDRQGNPVAATATLMQTFRMPNYGIIDSAEALKHASDTDPTATEWLKNNVAGTGPYYVADRTPGQQLILAAVPDGIIDPGYDSVTVRVINNGNIASLLRGGEINVGVYGLTQRDLNDLESAGLIIDHEKTPEFTYLQMATETGPLADPTVRQAIGYALPYEQIIDSVYFDRASRATSYVNEAAPGYAETFAQYTTDLDAARKLMDEAGNPSVSFPLHFNNSDPELEDTAILIQDSLAQIGVDVTIRPETPAAFQQLITQRATNGEGAPDALLVKWSSWIDDPKTPVSYATTTGGVNNYSMWSDPRVDEIAAANQFADLTDERAATYIEAQEIVADAAPLLPIARVGRSVALADGMTGASFAPEFGLRYWTLQPTE